MPKVREFDFKEEPPKKFVYDLLGNRVEVGDFVVYLDRFETPCLNLAWVQDITTSGFIIIKNMVFRGQFLFYNRYCLTKKVKTVLQDELACMKYKLKKE